MFIKIFENTVHEQALKRTFVKSAKIQAFPCGRRRSTEDTNDYVIPFDPEARLNTEANNRKHSSLNGFTQTYLKDWNAPANENGKFSLSLAGYLFDILLPAEANYTINTFAGAIAEKVNTTNYIYANILIEDVYLYTSKVGENDTGSYDYFTSVLRNQSVSEYPELSLDLEATTGSRQRDNFYFSGLSFSNLPLTGKAQTRSSTEEGLQTEVSLCVFEKDTTTGEWKIHEPARLPNIEHGATENSIVVGDVLIQSTVDNEGNLTVENHITSTTLETTESATTKNLVVSEQADIKTVNVEKNLNVTTTGSKATISDLEAMNANIGTLNVDNSYGGDGCVSAETFMQDGSKVSIIDLVKKDDDFWQLQISRINIK